MVIQEPIFIAGHNGLLGSAFLARLKKDGYSQIFTATRAELDLNNFEAVYKKLEDLRPKTIFLCAGRTGGILENQKKPYDLLTENLTIQLNVMRVAADLKVDRVVYFASSCMYPRLCQQPMRESDLFTGIPEQTSFSYAVAKMAGLQLCLAYNQQMQSTVFLPLIPTSAYGPKDNFDPISGHVLPALIHRFHVAKSEGVKEIVLWGSGTPQREFLFVDDLVDATLFILNRNLKEFSFPINIGTGQGQTIRNTAETIAKIVGYEGKISFDTSKPDGAPVKLLDSSQLDQLGWKPKFSFESGIRATYEWYLAQNKG